VRPPAFFRWFWDTTQNKDRLDGVIEFQRRHHFAEMYFDHPKGTEYDVLWQNETAVCFTKPINTTIPKINFGPFEFIGKALVDYAPAYHWYYHDRENGHVYQVYDTQDTRQLLRIDIANERRREAVVWTFFEMDVGPQDPLVFTINPAILATCKPYPSTGRFLKSPLHP